jgi:hypothetical protein
MAILPKKEFREVRHFVFSLIILTFLLSFFYLLSFSFTSIEVFHDLLTKCAFSLGGRALKLYLIHKGIPAGLAFLFTIVLRIFFFPLVGTPFILQMDAPGLRVY